MLVDEYVDRSATVADLPQSAGCSVVACLPTKDDLREQVAQWRPDVVIIDIDLPIRDTLESLSGVQAAVPHPMAMFKPGRQRRDNTSPSWALRKKRI
jgi:response regulator NasT